MNLAITSEKKLELKKHVNAIHCSNDLSLVQRKLFNALLFVAYPELPHNQKFYVPVRKLCNMIGYNSNDYVKLKKALLGLIAIAIEWNVIDYKTGKEQRWKASSILSAAEVVGGTCIYEYSSVMKELLFQPEIYGRINMHFMSRFKSGYGLALYENCIRYQGLPKTPWFPLDIFRKLMGVGSGKYTSFNDFRKRVIDIAVNEVNTISQIYVTPEIERLNQKPMKIRFLIGQEKCSNDTTQEKDEQLPGKDLDDLLKSIFTLSAESIVDLYKSYEVSYIQDKVNMIMASNSYLQGNIKGLAGYLIDSLRKDYKISKSSKVVLNQENKKKEQEENAQIDKEKKLKKRYEKYVEEKVDKYISSLKDTAKTQLIDAFWEDLKLKNYTIYEWYKKYDFDHPGVKAYLETFIREHKKQELGEIMSFNEFVTLVSESL